MASSLRVRSFCHPARSPRWAIAASGSVQRYLLLFRFVSLRSYGGTERTLIVTSSICNRRRPSTTMSTRGQWICLDGPGPALPYGILPVTVRSSIRSGMIAGEKLASDEVELWLERQPAPAIFERLFSAALDRLRPVLGVVRVLGYGNGKMERALLGVLLPVAVLMLELDQPPADRVESALVDRGQIVLR